MNIKGIVYKESSLNLKYSEFYHLSIQVDLNGFCLLIYNLRTEKYIYFQYYPFDHPTSDGNYFHKNVDKAIDGIGFLSNPFFSVTCTYVSQNETNIPTHLLQKEEALKVLNFSATRFEYEELHFTEIPFYNLTNIFAVPSFLVTGLKAVLPNIHFFNGVCPHLYLLNDLAVRYKKHNTLIIECSDSFCRISLAKGEKLLFNNSFKVSNGEDIIYYINIILKFYAIDLNTVLMRLIGMLNIQSIFYERLKMKFPNLEPLYLSNKRSVSSSLETINDHRFVNLFNAQKIFY